MGKQNKDRGCKVKGCTKPHYARGWCNPDYQVWLRIYKASGGTSLSGISEEERYWAKVDKNGPIPKHAPHLGRCWCWLGGVSGSGYGGFGRPSITAHRYSYQVFHGPVPEDLELDHLCRNRLCVNPDHLEAVTRQINQHRSNSVSGLNSRKTHCRRDHEFTPENTFKDSRGNRGCVECRRIRDRRRDRRKVKS